MTNHSEECKCTVFSVTCPHGRQWEAGPGAGKDRAALIAVAEEIDWDQQYASQYYIGEDAADRVLARLGFNWDDGINNESVAAFLKTLK